MTGARYTVGCDTVTVGRWNVTVDRGTDEVAQHVDPAEVRAGTFEVVAALC
jgi:hypothetical protein